MDRLDYFNQQVLRYQDDAYTLACYLVGSEQEAVAITQEAVKAAFRLCPQQKGISCRLLLLRQVCRLCRGRRPAGPFAEALPWLFNSFSIAIHERMTLVLVDVLGLDYHEAAAVTGLPVKNIARLLANARRKLGQSGQVVPATGAPDVVAPEPTATQPFSPGGAAASGAALPGAEDDTAAADAAARG